MQSGCSAGAVRAEERARCGCIAGAERRLLECARLDPLGRLPVEEAVRGEGEDSPRAEGDELVGGGAECAWLGLGLRLGLGLGLGLG